MRKAAKIVDLDEARTRLSRLVDEAAVGQEIVIAEAGVTRVRLVPLAAPKRRRSPAGSKGRIWIADDFKAASAQPFMRLAGSLRGAGDLSARKGFSKQ